jgi:hypothetical protein
MRTRLWHGEARGRVGGRCEGGGSPQTKGKYECLNYRSAKPVARMTTWNTVISLQATTKLSRWEHRSTLRLSEVSGGVRLSNSCACNAAIEMGIPFPMNGRCLFLIRACNQIVASIKQRTAVGLFAHRTRPRGKPDRSGPTAIEVRAARAITGPGGRGCSSGSGSRHTAKSAKPAMVSCSLNSRERNALISPGHWSWAFLIKSSCVLQRCLQLPVIDWLFLCPCAFKDPEAFRLGSIQSSTRAGAISKREVTPCRSSMQSRRAYLRSASRAFTCTASSLAV